MNNYMLGGFALGCIYILVVYASGYRKKEKNKKRDREKIFQMILYSLFLTSGYIGYYVVSIWGENRIRDFSGLISTIYLFGICKIIDYVYKLMYSGSKKKDIEGRIYLDNCDKNWCNLNSVIQVIICGCIIKIFTRNNFDLKMALMVILLLAGTYVSVSDTWRDSTILSIKENLQKEFSKIDLKNIVACTISIAIFSVIVCITLVDEWKQMADSMMAGLIMGAVITAAFSIKLNRIKSHS